MGLDAVEIVMELERRFEIEISDALGMCPASCGNWFLT
jgi:hypothetical protein